MITVEILNKWLSMPTETENIEFKEAKTQFDKNKLLKYCVALANEGGGHLILGISDQKPRKILGSSAFIKDNRIKYH